MNKIKIISLHPLSGSFSLCNMLLCYGAKLKKTIMLLTVVLV